MAEKDPAESGRRLHVTTLLVASRRALDNALSELGFPEDDDRIVEHDGRLAFLTCSHEEDCDDMFALISELSSRGESWELQSRIDAEAGRAVYQSFARYRPVEAVDAAVEDEPEPDTPESPLHDVETAEGLGGAEAHPEAHRAGRRVCDNSGRPRRPRHRPRPAPRFAAAAGGGDRRRRVDTAQRHPGDPAQCHARRRDEAARLGEAEKPETLSSLSAGTCAHSISCRP